MSAAFPLRLALLVCLLASCSRSGVRKAGVATRIVSLSPSTTEAIVAIGARAALVGRSRYCDYPPDVVAVPEVGGFVDPNFEAILALAPDLVTGARGPAGSQIADRLASHGAVTYFPETESFHGIDEMILGLGARTGHEDGARNIVAKVHARILRVEHDLLGRTPVKTLLIFGLGPIVAAGPGGFPDEMIRRAGGVNTVREGGAYPTLSLEHVLALDPDVIVDAAMSESRGIERIGVDSPGWRELRAVKAGRVVSLEDEVVLRPGPRIGEGLAILAHALHAEVRLDASDR